MTAPEPLKVTWEEARALLWEREWARLRFQVEYRHGGTVTADSWERVVEPVLGAVVARDEAAELRAAVNELLASGGAHGIERRLQLIDNGKGQRDRLEAAYARVCALAASEGQP